MELHPSAPPRRRAGASRLKGYKFTDPKYAAAKTLAAFGARASAGVELDMLTGRLVEVVDETTQPARVSLWLRAEIGWRKEPMNAEPMPHQYTLAYRLFSVLAVRCLLLTALTVVDTIPSPLAPDAYSGSGAARRLYSLLFAPLAAMNGVLCVRYSASNAATRS